MIEVNQEALSALSFSDLVSLIKEYEARLNFYGDMTTNVYIQTSEKHLAIKAELERRESNLFII